MMIWLALEDLLILRTTDSSGNTETEVHLFLSIRSSISGPFFSDLSSPSTISVLEDCNPELVSLSSWWDFTHRDFLLSGYFNPGIFLPVYLFNKTSSEQHK